MALGEAEPIPNLSEGKSLSILLIRSGSIIDGIRFYFGPCPTSTLTPAPTEASNTACIDEMFVFPSKHLVDQATTTGRLILSTLSQPLHSAKALAKSNEAVCTSSWATKPTVQMTEAWTIYLCGLAKHHAIWINGMAAIESFLEENVLRLIEERNEEFYGCDCEFAGEKSVDIQSGCEYKAGRLNGASMALNVNFISDSTMITYLRFLLFIDVSKK